MTTDGGRNGRHYYSFYGIIEKLLYGGCNNRRFRRSSRIEHRPATLPLAGKDGKCYLLLIGNLKHMELKRMGKKQWIG